MDNVLDFLRATLPWIAVGLALAVLCVRGAGKKKKKADYGTEGMCLGMCVGTAIGASWGNNIGLGISLGMLIGLAIGTCIGKEERGEDNAKKE